MQIYVKYPIFESKINVIHEDSHSMECLISPFEKNLSLSFANYLRKIILSCSIGYSITAVSISGISSEFESVPGMKEDTVDFLHNLKNLIFFVNNSITPHTDIFFELNVRGSDIILGKHLKCPEGVTVVNPETYLMTTNSTADFKISLLVQSGIGYHSHTINTLPKKYIPLDTSFSPIKHVSYRINTYSHYEEILFHIRTNRGLLARDAMCHALDILSKRSYQLLRGIDKQN